MTEPRPLLHYPTDGWDEAKHPAAPYAFIQWKGTDVCLDFHCVCGAHWHVDGDFVYGLRCGECGAAFEMPASVALKPVEKPVECTHFCEEEDD